MQWGRAGGGNSTGCSPCQARVKGEHCSFFFSFAPLLPFQTLVKTHTRGPTTAAPSAFSHTGSYLYPLPWDFSCPSTIQPQIHEQSQKPDAKITRTQKPRGSRAWLRQSSACHFWQNLALPSFPKTSVRVLLLLL